jgi:hypothetical protein
MVRHGRTCAPRPPNGLTPARDHPLLPPDLGRHGPPSRKRASTERIVGGVAARGRSPMHAAASRSATECVPPLRRTLADAGRAARRRAACARWVPLGVHVNQHAARDEMRVQRRIVQSGRERAQEDDEQHLAAAKHGRGLDEAGQARVTRAVAAEGASCAREPRPAHTLDAPHHAPLDAVRRRAGPSAKRGRERVGLDAAQASGGARLWLAPWCCRAFACCSLAAHHAVRCCCRAFSVAQDGSQCGRHCAAAAAPRVPGRPRPTSDGGAKAPAGPPCDRPSGAASKRGPLLHAAARRRAGASAAGRARGECAHASTLTAAAIWLGGIGPAPHRSRCAALASPSLCGSRCSNGAPAGCARSPHGQHLHGAQRLSGCRARGRGGRCMAAWAAWTHETWWQEGGSVKAAEGAKNR